MTTTATTPAPASPEPPPGEKAAPVKESLTTESGTLAEHPTLENILSEAADLFRIDANQDEQSSYNFTDRSPSAVRLAASAAKSRRLADEADAIRATLSASPPPQPVETMSFADLVNVARRLIEYHYPASVLPGLDGAGPDFVRALTRWLDSQGQPVEGDGLEVTAQELVDAYDRIIALAPDATDMEVSRSVSLAMGKAVGKFRAFLSRRAASASPQPQGQPVEGDGLALQIARDLDIAAWIDSDTPDPMTDEQLKPVVEVISLALSCRATAQGASPWVPTHQHVVGPMYRVIMRGLFTCDQKVAVVYDDADGAVWIRPASEFDDGRFRAISAPPPAEAAKTGAGKTEEQHL